jgi:hypothetical protein
MNPILPLVNGKAYEHADVQIVILGVPLVGVTAIDYSDSSEMSNNWGSGRFPVTRGYGKYEAKATLTLLMEEVENITTAAPNRRLQDIPEFNVNIVFIDPQLITRKHTIRNCRFKNNNRKSSSGDTKIEVELELITSHIDW